MAEKKLPAGVPEEQTPIPGGGESKGPPPKFGTPRPMPEAGGDVPRVVNQLERFGTVKGVKRYKIRSNNYHPQRTLYILARNEDEARDFYLTTTGLKREMERLKKNAPNATIEEADLVVRELVD